MNPSDLFVGDDEYLAALDHVAAELVAYGWDAVWQGRLLEYVRRRTYQIDDVPGGALAAGLPVPAVGRVVLQERGLFRVRRKEGEQWASLAGGLRHGAMRGTDLPAVGDFVILRESRTDDGRGVIADVLPRSSAFIRKQAGPEHEAQVVAANIDTVLIAASLASPLNERQLERYLTVAWESGATPVVVLTKADLCRDVAFAIAAVQRSGQGVPVLALSSVTGTGLDALGDWLVPGATLAVLGPSGVGKSSLVNALCASTELATGEVRAADHRGRHTTTRRQLLLAPSGALFIDTPGMRELQLWAADDGLCATFADIEQLALCCQFRDCTHGPEPGCAVRAAVESGELASSRLRNYVKLQRELAYAARKQDERAQQVEKQKWKQATRIGDENRRGKGR
ncbi:MAG: ribosome small subunit-dependent GTPase A [Firmicutes bacterium]|nr:ribosome small subunit-dependent GTPase A [Bacillota bacterium]